MLLSTPTEHFEPKIGFLKTMEYASDAGFDALDFSFMDEPGFYNEDSDINFFKDLKLKAQSFGLVFNQAHAPYPSSTADTEQTEQIFNNITRSMRNAAALGVKNIVVHPCQHLDYVDNKEQLFEINMNFYHKLIPYCEEYGIKVAIENMWKKYGSNKIFHSTCSTPQEFIRYFDELCNPCFTCCLDIGHAVLVCEEPGDFIRKLGNKRLGALHVHDVNGINDSHHLPYLGIVRWDDVTKALKEIDYKGDFTFETDGFIAPLPKELMPSAMKLLSDTGRYLIEKIRKD